MRIKLTSVYVDDQEKALRFDTDDMQADYERMKAHGVEFTMPPTERGSTPTPHVRNDAGGSQACRNASVNWIRIARRAGK